MTFLLGRQAIFGQDPPMSFRSTTAIRLPSRAIAQAIDLPPAPLPSTTTSYLSGSLMLRRSFAARFFEVSSELEAHRRKQLVLIIALAAGAEAFVKRGRENGYRHALIDRSLDRPAALTGIGDVSRKFGQLRILDQCS